MRVELNEQIKERLEAIALLMKTEKRVPQTAYFPFIVCFEWVNAVGYAAKRSVQEHRIKLCEAYNTYLHNDGQGSFEQVQKCLDELLKELDDSLFLDIEEETKSKMNTSKARLSAFMTAKMKK